MRILLLTRNHVVREFVTLAAGRMGAELDLQEHVSDRRKGHYDFLFVDDRGTLLEESMALIERLDSCQTVVLYNEENALHDIFDHQIKKPFLPSDIQHTLEAKVIEEESRTEEQVLNIQDIEEIRGLLESEGMEIVPEEALADEIDKENLVEEEPVQGSLEEKLLAAVSRMEPKKIRKLLKGAEVTLTIRFPKESV